MCTSDYDQIEFPSSHFPSCFFFLHSLIQSALFLCFWILQDKAGLSFDQTTQTDVFSDILPGLGCRIFWSMLLFKLMENNYFVNFPGQGTKLENFPWLPSLNPSSSMHFLCFSCFHHPFLVALTPNMEQADFFYSGQVLGACCGLYVFLGGGGPMRCCSSYLKWYILIFHFSS